MQIWDILLGSATELDLLRVGEALQVGEKPRTAMGVLQILLRGAPRPSLSDVLAHLSDDTVKLAWARAGLPMPTTTGRSRTALLEAEGSGTGSDWITVEAPRRKPRLAWQGMHSKAAVTSVPTQVLEVVSPGLAEHRDERQGQLGGFGAARARADAKAPVNRLIWTNDNLVALRTLLDERDPVTRDWRYRGKVDLVYIDPPFMVNNDFVADNSIAINVDDDEGVSAVKEPSLVEILAYKDTWREGLDSFLSMIRARLLLLKELLAPTGSIYVHLDWHAAHYVKVLMDEVFGYECLVNEIVWKRRTGFMGTFNRFGVVSDTLLWYSKTSEHYFRQLRGVHDSEYVKRFKYVDGKGRKYRLDNLTSPSPRPNLRYEYKGHLPPPNGWAVSRETMEKMDAEGRVDAPADKRARLQRRAFLDEREGPPIQTLWDDIPPINPMAIEAIGYPTQKPVALLERIISASCPPGGLVLDCFAGSGTTSEAAERLGRRWISIDNGKYATHLARKRLIQLHGQPRSPVKEHYDYIECETCKDIQRKKKRQRSPGSFVVRPFSVESMGVYLRAEAWLDAAGQSGAWRPEMVKVFGGEPVQGFTLLHGKDNQGWIHVGPLDAPVPLRQAWSIAREAADTDTHFVTILSADLVTLPHPEREAIKDRTGVHVTMRIIPKVAIDQVALRLRRGASADGAIESMAVPAFYTPLAIGIRAQVDGPNVKLILERCEVDVQSFVTSQRPALKPVTEKMTAAQRQRAEKELERWQARHVELENWLAKATTWKHFVDFWAVDWDYADNVGQDGMPIFDTDWQSFRIRRGKKKFDPLVLTAEGKYATPGRYQIAARVTDVFGNDGIAVVDVEVGR